MNQRDKLTTRVDARGQVTLPAAVRRHLRLQPGDLVSIEVEDSGTAVLRRSADAVPDFIANSSRPGPLLA